MLLGHHHPSFSRHIPYIFAANSVYVAELSVSKEDHDLDVYNNDFLTSSDWSDLILIKEHLEPLFLLTKSLKGNADLTEGVRKASYSTL